MLINGYATPTDKVWDSYGTMLLFWLVVIMIIYVMKVIYLCYGCLSFFSFFFFFFFMNKKFYSQDKQNYKEETRASSLMINLKQEGSKPTSKEPKTLFTNDHLAREWAALFAPLRIQAT